MSMSEIEQFKEKVLREYPRLTKASHFKFACHPGVPCFNACCADVNIFLTPYDIIRLKQALGVTSTEFLSKYTISPFDKKLHYPIILLAMNDDEKRTCPFVGDKGCTVYADRPWACRMYPLGLASPMQGYDDLDEEFYFLLEEKVCKGHGESAEQTVGQWLESQGITGYDEMGEEFKEISMHPYFQKGKTLTPEKIEMFFTVCYNLDSFRAFVFKSSFLQKFEVTPEIAEKIKTDDVELLRFGYRWLRFALFGEKTIQVRSDTLEAAKQQLAKEGKLPKGK